VVPPTWVVRLKVQSIGLLSIIIESVHLFHLGKYCHKWKILCLVHGTSINKTLVNCKCVSSIDGLTDVEMSSLLVSASIFKFIFASPLSSYLAIHANLSRQLVKSHCCELSAILSNTLYAASHIKLKNAPLDLCSSRFAFLGLSSISTCTLCTLLRFLSKSGSKGVNSKFRDQEIKLKNYKNNKLMKQI
jgi:hypothetical protein